MKSDGFGCVELQRNGIENMQKGILSRSYRGCPPRKCPFDLAIYMDVIWELRPRTIVEFGSNRGGSALWFADMLTAYQIEGAHVFSLDYHPVKDLTDPRITFGF